MACSQVIEPVDFDVHAACHLNDLGGMPAGYFQKLFDLKEVNVFGLFEDGVRVATMLVRWGVDNITDELEAEVVALAGQGQTDLTAFSLSSVETYAREKGAQKLTFNTERPGLVRKLAHKACEAEMSVSWRL